jgi:hypothetical protein
VVPSTKYGNAPINTEWGRALTNAVSPINSKGYG